MERPARILAVDDTPTNLEVLEAILVPRGYQLARAGSGPEALASVAREQPDLVLLDVVMPGMDGIEVCRRLREAPATRFLPVVIVTANAGQERGRALEVGADDFLTKPIDRAELLARVGSLVRIKAYHDTIQAQAQQLAAWNRTLEAQVREQVAELERLGRLRRFLSPRLAELLVSAEGETLLESHRRLVAVVCCQLPGFTAFAEAAAPEEVLGLLGEYHDALGAIIARFEGTVGTLDEDRLKVFFNDPLPVEDPAGQAVRMALAMGERARALIAGWRRRGYELDFGAGIDLGYATMGTVEVEGRAEYSAIGPVGRVAWGLCQRSTRGQVLVTQRVHADVEAQFEADQVGELALEGYNRPVVAYRVERARAAEGAPAEADRSGSTSTSPDRGPLTAREWEVVELITRGHTNREIAEALVIAEGTAVRHVANILNKLGLKSRAQVAVWAVERGRAPGARAPY